MLEGVIFDMDGVLVDSEELICRAAIAMFAEHGVKAKAADFLPFVGTGENRYLGGVAEQHGCRLDIERDKARTYELYGQLIRGQLQPLPGAREFLAGCRGRGLRTALATSADRIKVTLSLGEIGLPEDGFDALATGSEVAHKKPAPDIFLLAARKLGLPAASCLVVEDAVSGVAAAKAAGARCLALLTSFPREKLSAADFIAPNLSAVPPEALNW
jgi:HAD superfamily hydrolase (TIGR01509 family)